MSFLWLKEIHLENTLKSHSQPLIHSMPWQLANHALIYPQERHIQVTPHSFIPSRCHACLFSTNHASVRPSVHPFVRPSVHPSIRPSVRPSIHSRFCSFRALVYLIVSFLILRLAEVHLCLYMQACMYK